MILAKEILSSTGRKNKHSGFTMIELIVALTFALIFVTAVMHTIAAFGYSALYSKKNDMKFRKLAEYKLRQINILPSLEDNRKFHVTKYSDDTPPGFFVEKIPTCIFKFSPVDFIYFSKDSTNSNIASLYLSGEKSHDKYHRVAIAHYKGNTDTKTLGGTEQSCAFSLKLSDKPNNIFIKPIFSEKCKFPLDIGIYAPKDMKNNKPEFKGLMLDGTKFTKSKIVTKINNWNELSDKKILFNYQNLLIFQMLGNKLKKLYVYFE